MHTTEGGEKTSAAVEPAANELAANELAAGELAANELAVDELAVDGLGVNELAANELGINELAVDGLGVDELAADELATNDPAAVELAANEPAAVANEEGELVEDAPYIRAIRAIREASSQAARHSHPQGNKTVKVHRASERKEIIRLMVSCFARTTLAEGMYDRAIASGACEYVEAHLFTLPCGEKRGVFNLQGRDRVRLVGVFNQLRVLRQTYHLCMLTPGGEFDLAHIPNALVVQDQMANLIELNLRSNPNQDAQYDPIAELNIIMQANHTLCTPHSIQPSRSIPLENRELISTESTSEWFTSHTCRYMAFASTIANCGVMSTYRGNPNQTMQVALIQSSRPNIKYGVAVWEDGESFDTLIVSNTCALVYHVASDGFVGVPDGVPREINTLLLTNIGPLHLMALGSLRDTLDDLVTQPDDTPALNNVKVDRTMRELRGLSLAGFPRPSAPRARELFDIAAAPRANCFLRRCCGPCATNCSHCDALLEENHRARSVVSPTARMNWPSKPPKNMELLEQFYSDASYRRRRIELAWNARQRAYSKLYSSLYSSLCALIQITKRAYREITMNGKPSNSFDESRGVGDSRGLGDWHTRQQKERERNYDRERNHERERNHDRAHDRAHDHERNHDRDRKRSRENDHARSGESNHARSRETDSGPKNRTQVRVIARASKSEIGEKVEAFENESCSAHADALPRGITSTFGERGVYGSERGINASERGINASERGINASERGVYGSERSGRGINASERGVYGGNQVGRPLYSNYGELVYGDYARASHIYSEQSHTEQSYTKQGYTDQSDNEQDDYGEQDANSEHDGYVNYGYQRGYIAGEHVRRAEVVVPRVAGRPVVSARTNARGEYVASEPHKAYYESQPKRAKPSEAVALPLGELSASLAARIGVRAATDQRGEWQTREPQFVNQYAAASQFSYMPPVHRFAPPVRRFGPS